jgi:predicted nucleotidyltransferase
MTLKQLVIDQKPNIQNIAKKYGAYNIRLFGSVAKGVEHSNSDVDILVNMEKGRTIFDLGGLLMELQILLNHKVDVVTEAGLRKRIQKRILKEAVPL